MRVFLTLARRELAAYFVTWTGYLILTLAALLMGLSFVVLLFRMRLEPNPLPITQLFFGTQFFWTIMLLVPPLITMRLFAQERSSGTYETLLTTPVRDAQVVLAKYCAALVLFVLLWLPLVGCLAVGWRYGGGPGMPDPGTLVGTVLGVLLVGMLWLATGCLGSALSRTQSSAAMLSLAGCLGIFLAGWLSGRFDSNGDWLSQLLYAASVRDQMEDFVRGLVDTRPVVLCLTMTGFVLFLTLRVVESRRWKR